MNLDLQGYVYEAVEVCVILEVSYGTLNNWYKWKRKHPEDPNAKLLPAFAKVGAMRLWDREGVKALQAFKQVRPLGRNGIMGTKHK